MNSPKVRLPAARRSAINHKHVRIVMPEKPHPLSQKFIKIKSVPLRIWLHSIVSYFSAALPDAYSKKLDVKLNIAFISFFDKLGWLRAVFFYDSLSIYPRILFFRHKLSTIKIDIQTAIRNSVNFFFSFRKREARRAPSVWSGSPAACIRRMHGIPAGLCDLDHNNVIGKLYRCFPDRESWAPYSHDGCLLRSSHCLSALAQKFRCLSLSSPLKGLFLFYQLHLFLLNQ